jgi:hypothetical protein
VVVEPGEARTSEGFQSGRVPRKTPNGEVPRMVAGRIKRWEESLGRGVGTLREMVAAPEEVVEVERTTPPF